MKPSIFNVVLLIVGLAIVAACGVLFVQCTGIAENNVKSENLFAQTVLDDVLRSLPRKYPNGIRPAELRWELYFRVALYTGIGIAFIGAAAYRQYRFQKSGRRDSTAHSKSDF